MRNLLVAAAAIVVLAVGGVLVIAVATRDVPVRSAGASAPPPAPEPLPPPAPDSALARMDALRLAPGASADPRPPPPLVVDPAPPPPPAGSWEAVPVAARPAALGGVGAAVGRGLAELEAEVSACFSEASQSRYARSPFTSLTGASLAEDGGNPVLVLELETVDGAVRIVDAPLESRGSTSEGVIACAQGVLRGQRFEAPGTRPGGRHRMLFTLMQ